MWSKVERYIEKHKLLDGNELYLVALSGGADSVALLLLLHDAGYRVEAAHCNFHLRGAESDRDEAFCSELCGRLGIALHRVHFDTEAYAELHKVSIEMAARELRYGWFEQLCKDLGAAGICVAHHRDDSVETVILNLIRGTGLRGLTGIQPLTSLGALDSQGDKSHMSLRLIRPLLCVSRAEIEAFLAKRKQKYVTDSTNLVADVQRNKVRLQLLPLLRELNPAVVDNIQRTADNLQGAQALLDALLRNFASCNELILSNYGDFSSREYAVFEWLKNFGFNGSQVRQILDAETGKIITSVDGYDVLRDRDRLLLEPSLTPMKVLKIPEEGTYIIGENVKKASFLNEKTPGNSSIDKFCVSRKPVYVSKDPDVATVDADKVAFPLTVRSVGEGDWMIPYGMKGRKLLSDLMTDRKMTIFEKRRQLVVVDAHGCVVWLSGLRVDGRVAVSATTVAVLEMQFVSTET